MKDYCPIATVDIKVNLKNRNWAFKNVNYGPANPEEDNMEYWGERAKEWNTDIDEAQTMRCGNCAAFIQTPEMLECIVNGIDPEEGEEGYAVEVEEAADLGYCELFDFKCAGDRTCSAWLVGGPVTKPMSNRQKQMLMMAKTEYDMEDEEEDED
jgi:hypothetical protein